MLIRTEGLSRVEVWHPLGFADLVYISHSNDVEVGEIKPSTWDINPAKKVTGKMQLAKEILGISRRLSLFERLDANL
jgi:hypothetical protein